MSKCPFWSSRREKVSCSNECPMSPALNNNEICPFIECIGSNNQESLWSTTELLYPSETTDLILSKEDYLVTCGYAPINTDKSLVCFALFSY